jgi:hypothetical protein
VGLASACLEAYAAIWASTLASAAVLALAGARLAVGVRRVLGLTLTPAGNAAPHVAHVLALAAHNLPIAAWPLLLGLTGAHRHRLARGAADSAVLACMLVNSVPVGAALGAYGSALIAYVPQLPLEWAGLALGYGGWLVQRRRALGAREGLLWLALIAAVLLAAAMLETLAVPHR